MTHQETILRFRVYRVWNIPERPSLHGTRDLMYSSSDLGNAEEFRLCMQETWGTGDDFVVEDSGQDICLVEREIY
jgi:hypothetical protein